MLDILIILKKELKNITVAKAQKVLGEENGNLFLKKNLVVNQVR